MQRLKRAIKKMAAIGAGVAMLGATITGAMAQDLADYPAPFVDKSGVFDESTAIIVGDSAAASDTLGAVDIATNLQFSAKTPVSSGAGTIQVSGGITEDIPIGRGIANSTSYALDWNLDDSDISSFMDTSVQFQGKDYDVHDELVLLKDSPSIETSLSSSDDNYEDSIFMEAQKKSIYYFLMIDDTDLNISKATSTEPFEVKFLGKNLKITNTLSSGGDAYNDRFTAYVGTEYFMDVGDVVTVEGKKVTLVNVGSGGSIIVDVDGTIETIPASSTKTVNGIEITVDETFYANTKSERAGSLIIGKDAQATYKHDDAYIGEDAASPEWRWAIGNLGTKTDTTLNTSAQGVVAVQSGPYIAVYNNFRKSSSRDNPAGVGECYDLPNNYASICVDSLTVADDDYVTLTIEWVDDASLADSGKSGMSTSQKAIHIEASAENALKIPKDWIKTSAGGNGTLNDADKKTTDIWLASLNTSAFGVFYKDPEHIPSIRYIGALKGPDITAPTMDTGVAFAQFNYKDTKDANINISFLNQTAVAAIELDVNGDATSELSNDGDDIFINFTMTATSNFESLGPTKSKEEATELVWNTGTELGLKDENQRTKYGIIIKDPKSNGASDQVVLEIPSDQVQANVVIKGQATTVAGGSTSYIPADITIDTKLSSEVAGSETAHYLILVGGPCANPTVEKVSSLGKTCAGWDMGAGEAIVKMAANGNKVALLVAGTDAIDTRMAAKVVANYEDYDLSGSAVVVTGSLSAPVIKVA